MEKTELKPAIGLYATTAILIGSVIGSGVFVSSAAMARNSPSGIFLLSVWGFAGLLTLIGALTLSELASSMPRTGGLYVYLKECFGEGAGFYFGWANFMVAGSGGVAAVSFIFGSHLNELFPLWHPSAEVEKWALHIPYLGNLFPFADISEKLSACFLVLVLTWINTRGIKESATLQSISTTLKVLALFLIVGVALCAPHGSTSHLWVSKGTANLSLYTMMGLLAATLGSAFFAYDGWANAAMVAGEVKNPEKTVPRALILGTLIVITVYLLVNWSYLYVFPVETLSKIPGDRIAAAVARTVVGSGGAIAVALIILHSTFDGTNAGILTNARVYFAMSRDRIFPKFAGSIHPKYGTPSHSLWLQGFWACVLLITGSFDLIMSMYVWVNWLFYLMMSLAVFAARKRNLPRVFEMKGYPYVPAAFASFSFFYLLMTLLEDIRTYQAGTAPNIKSAIGIMLVLAGTPLYLWMKRHQIFRRKANQYL